MEALLQNHKYQPQEINILLVDELKIQIRSIVELCAEGKIPVHEAGNILAEETSISSVYQCKLLGKLDEIDNNKNIEEESRAIQKEMVLRILQDLEDYSHFLSEAAVDLWEIGEGVDYLENRKTKLKTILKTKGQQAPNSPPPQSAEPKALEDNSYFMQILKNEYPIAFAAMKNGISVGIVEFKDNHFNFKCDKGCVGLIFSEAGYTGYKQIARFILINNEEPAENTLKNCKKNSPPAEWERIKPIFFPTTPK